MSSASTPRKHAILLGEGKWIEFVDLTGRYEQAIDIDPLIRELEPMWSALETQCVAGCCGLDAFDFYPESIASAKTKLDSAVVCVKLGELRSALETLRAEVVVSRRLNNYADRTVFDALLVHLQSNFCKQRDGDT